MSDKPLHTPILLIAFNRPDTTRRVFEAIRKARPAQLFIAVDGPRPDKPKDVELCEKTRSIAREVDWPCEVRTLFHEKNLGCKYGPVSALDWFFEQVEGGIILEDDCLPNPSFFSFCDDLLLRHKDNKTIMHISGNNFQNGILRGDRTSSYYFSKYTHSWGWATWSDRWKLFHQAIKVFDDFKKSGRIKDVDIGKSARKFWMKNFKKTLMGNDSWDSLWMYTVWYYNGLAVLPQHNLVSNIGFNNMATNTTKTNKTANMSTSPISKIIHPINIYPDIDADEYTFCNIYHTRIVDRILSVIDKKIRT